MKEAQSLVHDKIESSKAVPRLRTCDDMLVIYPGGTKHPVVMPLRREQKYMNVKEVATMQRCSIGQHPCACQT